MIIGAWPSHTDRFTSHTPVAQKIADQRWLIANSAKRYRFFSSISFVTNGLFG